MTGVIKCNSLKPSCVQEWEGASIWPLIELTLPQHPPLSCPFPSSPVYIPPQRNTGMRIQPQYLQTILEIVEP